MKFTDQSGNVRSYARAINEILESAFPSLAFKIKGSAIYGNLNDYSVALTIEVNFVHDDDHVFLGGIQILWGTTQHSSTWMKSYGSVINAVNSMINNKLGRMIR